MTKCCGGLCFSELVKCSIEEGYKLAWGWTASSGQGGGYPYKPPSPWEFDPNYSDEGGIVGSHGGCSTCAMTLIHLRKPYTTPPPTPEISIIMIIVIIIILYLIFNK